MSISSHLTPEPERRLWLLVDSMRRSVEWADAKLTVLLLLCAIEAAYVGVTGPSGDWARAALLALGLALVSGVFALLPLDSTPKWLPLLEPAGEKLSSGENLLTPQALAKLTFAEAVLTLDRYLGGGITATQYHEDLVREAVFQARVAVRKRRLFHVVLFLALLGQFALLSRAFGR